MLLSIIEYVFKWIKWTNELPRLKECYLITGVPSISSMWIFIYCHRICCLFLLVILLVFFLPSIFHLLLFISRTSVLNSWCSRCYCCCLYLRAREFFFIAFVPVSLFLLSINEIYVLCVMRICFSLCLFRLFLRFNWFLLF